MHACGSPSIHHVPPTLSLYHELGQESDCPMCSQPTGDFNRWSRPEGLWQPEDGGYAHWGHPRATADPRFAWITGEPRPVGRSRLPTYELLDTLIDLRSRETICLRIIGAQLRGVWVLLWVDT